MAVSTFNINGDPNDQLYFKPKMLINGGYTGKNQEEVQKHIDELKRIGVPAPEKTPVFFPKFPERLTQDEEIPCLDEKGHIGEAEYVLIVSGGEIYITAGSDHTDRTLETVSIPKAKQMYPNTISIDVWKLAYVEEIVEVKDLEGLVLYSGTVAGKFEIDYSPYFEVELKDPCRKLTMSSAYRFKPVTQWFKG